MGWEEMVAAHFVHVGHLEEEAVGIFHAFPPLLSVGRVALPLERCSVWVCCCPGWGSGPAAAAGHVPCDPVEEESSWGFMVLFPLDHLSAAVFNELEKEVGQ